MSRTHRLAVLTLAATLLATAPTAWAASPGFGEGGSFGFADWLQQSWSWLAGWWGGAQEKLRCGIDPNGGPCVPAPTPTADHGCGIDPNGCSRSAYTLELDLGCDIDPDGSCVAAPRATEKHRCGIDPDGGPCLPNL